MCGPNLPWCVEQQQIEVNGWALMTAVPTQRLVALGNTVSLTAESMCGVGVLLYWDNVRTEVKNVRTVQNRSY